MDTKLLAKANEFIKTRNDASFSVLDESGFPSASAIWLMGHESIAEIYFSTPVGSNKYKRLQKSNKACICAYTGFSNLTLVGEAEILTDQASKTKHWQEPFIHIYPGGDTDPGYCIIKFVTKRVSLHIEHEGGEFLLKSTD
ncbi:MAG: pyridoxamine 5'-phosphate oxidase family protein [Defluviitaleaceae bacterium]|nr:pyridoxamine 5'-phosphate oxidase family protein [Defluviitaleaceae bacterium]